MQNPNRFPYTTNIKNKKEMEVFKMNNNDDNMEFNIPIVGGGAFNFSATKPETLGATEYTLVTITVDISGSVIPFSKELLETVKTAIKERGGAGS